MTAEQQQKARARHKGTKGPIFYTPDFLVHFSGGIQRAVEVKLDGYLGDEAYQQKLQRVQAILMEHGYEYERVRQ